MDAPEVFISYSHKDEAWKDRLVRQLRVLELEGAYVLWDDRKIAAGDGWRAEIGAALERALSAWPWRLLSRQPLERTAPLGAPKPPRRWTGRWTACGERLPKSSSPAAS